MSHLSTDRLAALGDEEPTPAETAHLATCGECARERAAYRALVAMARTERDAIGLPLTRWESIAGALAADSAAVESSPTMALSPRGRTHHPLRMALRAAAAMLLFAGGAVAGRVSTGFPPLPLAQRATQASSSDAGAPSAVNASFRTNDSASFTSIDDARLAQARSEALYQQAVAYLAEHDTAGAGDGSPAAVRSRLAAFDQMIPLMSEAVRQAPHDPVMNGYYLTTLGQREATLRQLNTVLPASLRSNSF
jgi:hypothetical protein